MKRILIFLWLVFLPTQLGLHFWPTWSHVMGLRVDYLAPTLYFLDVLWILMVFNLPKSLFDKRDLKKCLILYVFVLINILVAGNRWEAGYRWIRIFQWIITFKFILNNKQLFRETLLKVVPIWIIGESLLGLAQVVNGGSLNGVFYWLGERRFSYTTIGVAQISYLGQGLIRAYGTFSHPNSFAGFLLVSLIYWWSISPNPLFDKRGQRLFKTYKWIVIFCGILGLFLSGSRTVWGITIGLLIFNIKNIKLGYVVIGLGLIMLMFGLISNSYRISDFVGGWDSEGMSKRGALMVASINMIKDHPLFGVGAGNFLVKLPEYQQNSGVFWLQPVHNIIFLMMTEFGLIGFVLLFMFIKKIKYNNNLVILGIILITGMVDHYWLTLPQNWWLMVIVIGLM